jgi:arylsulfatase A-like enzyme
MSAPSPADGTESTLATRAAAGVLAGFALLAAVDALAVTLFIPLPRAGVGLRLAYHLADAAETLGVGLLAAVLVGAFVRFLRPPWWFAVIAYTAAATVLIYPGLNDALRRQASFTLQGRFLEGLYVLFLVIVGAAVPAAHVTGALFSRGPRLRWVGLLGGLIILLGGHRVIPDDYFGIHAAASWIGATFAGASIAPLVERWLRAQARVRRGRAGLAALAVFAILGVVVPPGNAVRFELFRQPCAIAPWLLAATVWPAPRLHAAVAVPPSPWLEDRSTAPPLPPTPPRLLGDKPVIVLITVDALRADAVSDPANDPAFPTFAAMKAKGAYFTHVTSAASQTSLSLTTVFSGRYFSELVWGEYGRGYTRFTYAADDPSPRFPQLLTDDGVVTAMWGSVTALGAGFGVARGFRDHTMVIKGTVYAQAAQVIEPLLGRLQRAGKAPLFLYTHLMEAHAPYDRGSKTGSDHARYLSEVAIADREIGRVQALLEQRFGDRWALFVSADHGEAFGEHQTYEHSKTLYQELVHVPLLAVGPRIPHRVVDQRVGLVDLGPTLLDLFGVDTPASFEGQSLVPLLAGQDVTLTRPILSEGRLRRALTLPDGLKVIEDPRRKVVEVYDLAADPGETRNLFDLEPARADPALATLRQFFAVHAVTTDGYQPPFEP